MAWATHVYNQLHDPKDIWAMEVRLYTHKAKLMYADKFWEGGGWGSFGGWGRGRQICRIVLSHFWLGINSTI